MIEIDGSEGEGGGQILRTSAALSVHTGKSITVSNIRARRNKPGLRPQHVTAIKVLEKISDARTKGVEVGSDRIEFTPGAPKAGSYSFDIGTAGSITLVFETITLALFGSGKRFDIELRGGTDVDWSPPWDYFKNVFLPIVRSMGIDVESDLLRRGHYPEGGGRARLMMGGSSEPSGIKLTEREGDLKVEGRIHLSNLPDHIAKRMRNSAVNALMEPDMVPNIVIERTKPLSTGTGIVLWAVSGASIIGSSTLGRKGFPAEKVGEQCANVLLEEIDSGATADIHAMDQMVPFMGLVGDSEVLVREITEHTRTNIHVVERITDAEFHIDEAADPKRVRT